MDEKIKALMMDVTDTLEEKGYHVYNGAGYSHLVYDRHDKPLAKLQFDELHPD